MKWGEEERDAAADHIDALARRHRIEVRVHHDPTKAAAFALTRQVWIPEPANPVDYLVGLHELGHLVSKVARRWLWRYPALGAEALTEGAAWAWATSKALPHLTDGMTAGQWDEVGRYFAGYLRHAAGQPPEKLAALI